jgi:gliding motility-associated-like protein
LCFPQYILNGSAQKNSCNCYTLTPATLTQSGSVWNSNKINLTSSFDFWFNVNLGCLDANGADGIVFILQPISTSIGSTGEGMGFAGVTPSVGIALDTWQNFNLNDPAFDHISFQANGNINHNSDLAGPVPISSSSDNVEDCQWHQLRITWDAATKWLRTYFDGVLRLEKQLDLVTTIFNNDPNVYWGFTGATGGAVNLQQFCTALDPVINVSATNNIACKDSVVQFTSASVSFAPIVSYNWTFGDGATSSLQMPPPHVYATAGTYPVHLKIKGLDGCENDTVQTITIASAPQALLNISDACFNRVREIILDTTATGVNYLWSLDGGTAATQFPLLMPLATGLHTLQLTATSVYNCGLPATAKSVFNIKPIPEVQIQTNDACVNTDIFFTGTQLDNTTTIAQWTWYFGDSKKASVQNPVHRYLQKGDYTSSLVVIAGNGCSSDTVYQPITINAAYAFAGNDTTVVKGHPFQLSGEGNGAFLWSPSAGLSNATIDKPVFMLSQDEVKFILTITTPEGCVATDAITIKAMKGPTVYVPTGFTPNGDGRNDVLRPVYVGIKELKQFAVFNRWGQMLFTTTDMRKGWEAKTAMVGTYVWLISAVNFLGQPVLLKGTVILMR